MKTFIVKIMARFSRPTDDVTRKWGFQSPWVDMENIEDEFKVANKMTDVVQVQISGFNLSLWICQKWADNPITDKITKMCRR